MLPHPLIPIPAGLAARYSGSSAGRSWLSLLPALVEQCLDQWRLTPDLAPGSVPWHGHGAIVVPVRRDNGSAAVLKVAFPHDEAKLERHALALWGGRGAVSLLAADAGACSMLLERLDAGRSAAELPLDEAAHVWGGTVRQLGLVPDHRSEWREFGHIAARAEQSARPVAPWDGAQPMMSWCIPTCIS